MINDGEDNGGSMPIESMEVNLSVLRVRISKGQDKCFDDCGMPSGLVLSCPSISGNKSHTRTHAQVKLSERLFLIRAASRSLRLAH